MVLTKSLLILEDDLQTLSKLLEKLYVLENDQPYAFATVILTTNKQVEEYINKNPAAEFDIILLDRDCKLGASFQVLDIERFGADKVISISSVPEYNEDARKRGVKRIIEKNNEDLDIFAERVVTEVERMITPARLLNMRH